jgi:rhodanese-related sulfurtransferase
MQRSAGTIDDLLREARARLRRLEPREALAAARRGALIVDIRSEQQRLQDGVVPGAHFVPRNVLEWRADPRSEHRDELLAGAPGPLILMCVQGYQSSLAAATLQEIGVPRATDMIGGFEAWRAAGLPVTSPGHWDGIYRRIGPAAVSWRQDEATVSLELIDSLDPSPSDPVVDVGGGCSPLAGALLARGWADVAVLDWSPVALAEARARLGPAGRLVRWIHADVLAWTPDRAYGLWHDRAVFHFLVEPADRARYVRAVRVALRPGGHAIVASFAADGPTRCSGLPVARYDPDDLQAALGRGFSTVATRREAHVTPGGATQPFTWVVVRRDDG